MKILSTENLSPAEIVAQIQSVRSKAEDCSAIVRPIVDGVRDKGDAYICELTERFDKWPATPATLKVSAEEIKEAYTLIEDKTVQALRASMENVQRTHEGMLVRKSPIVEGNPGVKVWSEFRPVERVGLYVPGGKAVYPSTVIMLAIPATVAGCETRVMCTPAGPNGKCAPIVLVAADLCGISEIYKVGGAQAIAGMAFGTDVIPQVDKVFGPGNSFVTTAKQMLSGDGVVAMDMPAGPSEIAVMCSGAVRADWIAADLLSQLEHGEDSQAVLITDSKETIEAIQAEMDKQTALLPRAGIIEESRKISFAVLVKDEKEMVKVANGYASEHLEIITGDEADELRLAGLINNAGSIFLGALSSEPLGDYASGANHTLPTSGFAKAYSALSANSFGKMIQIQRIDAEGIRTLEPIVAELARMEGLQAHGRAVTIRVEG